MEDMVVDCDLEVVDLVELNGEDVGRRVLVRWSLGID
jgi:hypothetical protein